MNDKSKIRFERFHGDLKILDIKIVFSDRAQIWGILWIWVVEAKPRFCRAMEKRRTSLKVGLGGFLAHQITENAMYGKNT